MCENPSRRMEVGRKEKGKLRRARGMTQRIERVVKEAFRAR